MKIYGCGQGNDYGSCFLLTFIFQSIYKGVFVSFNIFFFATDDNNIQNCTEIFYLHLFIYQCVNKFWKPSFQNNFQIFHNPNWPADSLLLPRLYQVGPVVLNSKSCTKNNTLSFIKFKFTEQKLKRVLDASKSVKIYGIYFQQYHSRCTIKVYQLTPIHFISAFKKCDLSHRDEQKIAKKTTQCSIGQDNKAATSFGFSVRPCN